MAYYDAISDESKRNYEIAKLSSCPREPRVASCRQGQTKFCDFKVFRGHLKEFSIFFHEIYMIARSYQVLAADIKTLNISPLVSLETRLRVPILAVF